MKEPRFQVSISSSNIKSDHNASTMVISCVDFRFQDENKFLLDNILGLKDDYDYVSLPGASLVLGSDKHPSWKQMVEEIIPLLQKLHKIKRVILLDHMDCGAYKLAFGQTHMSTKQTEMDKHEKNMSKAKKRIQDKFPDNLSMQNAAP